MISVEVVEGSGLAGDLRYSEESLGLEFVPQGHSDSLGEPHAMLLFTTVELSFSLADGRALAVGGYAPAETWRSRVVQRARPDVSGIIKIDVALDPPPLSGEGFEIVPSGGDIDYDERSGWMRIGADDADYVVQFAAQGMLGVRGSRPVTLLLRPQVSSRTLERAFRGTRLGSSRLRQRT